VGKVKGLHAWGHGGGGERRRKGVRGEKEEKRGQNYFN
jgi:hypothetical protein